MQPVLKIGMLCIVFAVTAYRLPAQFSSAAFKVIAFYTAKNDPAHISFVHEANRWFPKIARQYHFQYDATDNWNNLNDFSFPLCCCPVPGYKTGKTRTTCCI
ncbi:hypothetical protein [Niabella ginsenosidivorans]|uniref:hypothetical protein n=1 Tax=Niabella ginsenosidivorans TaxID=1176587 RepID=UPI001FDFD2EC|nr:hypothetical protein [Niabella ginsenosidivorans]